MNKLKISYIVIGVVVLLAIALAFGLFGKPLEGQPTVASDFVKVSNISAGDTVSSPLHIEGQAKGTWYFEAVFPIEVVDVGGKIIGQGHADAQGDWMTDDMVPFKADIVFTTASSTSGKIILKKDNPSGDPARDQSLEIPIKF